MKIKVEEAEGAALNWMVSKVEGPHPVLTNVPYSTMWGYGGPIIARECICINGDNGDVIKSNWDASIYGGEILCSGETPLIAAMRCYVVSKLGEEVEVPDNLLGGV